MADEFTPFMFSPHWVRWSIAFDFPKSASVRMKSEQLLLQLLHHAASRVTFHDHVWLEWGSKFEFSCFFCTGPLERQRFLSESDDAAKAGLQVWAGLALDSLFILLLWIGALCYLRSCFWDNTRRRILFWYMIYGIWFWAACFNTQEGEITNFNHLCFECFVWRLKRTGSPWSPGSTAFRCLQREHSTGY